VASSIGEIHDAMVVLLSKDERNVLQESLMSEGIKELEDCAKTAAESSETTARDVNMVVQGKRVAR